MLSLSPFPHCSQGLLKSDPMKMEVNSTLAQIMNKQTNKYLLSCVLLLIGNGAAGCSIIDCIEIGPGFFGTFPPSQVAKFYRPLKRENFHVFSSYIQRKTIWTVSKMTRNRESSLFWADDRNSQPGRKVLSYHFRDDSGGICPALPTTSYTHTHTQLHIVCCFLLL